MQTWLKQHKKMIGASALVLGCLALAFFVGDFALAEETLNEGDVTTTGDVIARMIAGLGSILVALLGWLVSAVIGLIVSVAQYNNFTTAQAVSLAWPVLRDFANLFFIIVLLITAIGTILGVESYQYKEKLPEIIIMAVFINFSKTITGLLIDISQVVMLTFVAAFKDIAAGNLITGSKAMKFLTYHGSGGEGLGIGEALLGAAVTVLLAVFLLIIFFFVLLAVLLVLLWRILMLWVLAVLSPLPYLMMVFPGGHHYAQEWWETLTKYLFSGPTLAFFLWLTVSLVSVTNGELGVELGVQHDPTPAAGVPNAVISKIGDSAELLGFLIIISLLLIGLEVASKSGVMGGEFAGKVMHGLEHEWAGGKFGFETIARKWNEKGLINPAAMWKGYVERREEMQHAAHAKGEALGRQRVERILTGGKLRLPRLDVVERQHEDEAAKNFAAMEKNEKAHSAYKLLTLGGEEGKRERRGLLKAAGSEGHIDDIMGQRELQQTFINDDETQRLIQGGKVRLDDDGKLVHNFNAVQAFLKYYTRGDHEGARLAYDIGEIGKKIGHYEYAGQSEVNAETGEYEWQRDAKVSLSESGKKGPQDLVGNAPHQYIPFSLGGIASRAQKVFAFGAAEFKRFQQAFPNAQARDRSRFQPREANLFMGGTSADGGVGNDGYAAGRAVMEWGKSLDETGQTQLDEHGNSKMVWREVHDDHNKVIRHGLTGEDIQRMAQAFTADPLGEGLRQHYVKAGGEDDDKNKKVFKIVIAEEVIKALGLQEKINKDTAGRYAVSSKDEFKEHFMNSEIVDKLNAGFSYTDNYFEQEDGTTKRQEIKAPKISEGAKIVPAKETTTPPSGGAAPPPPPSGGAAAGGGAGGAGGAATPPPYAGPSADDIAKAVAEAMRTVMAELQAARPPKADAGSQEFAPLIRKLSAAMGEQQQVLEVAMRGIEQEKAGVQAGGHLGGYNRRMLQAMRLISGRLSSLNRAGTLPAYLDDVLDRVNNTILDLQGHDLDSADVRVSLEQTLKDISV